MQEFTRQSEAIFGRLPQEFLIKRPDACPNTNEIGRDELHDGCGNLADVGAARTPTEPRADFIQNSTLNT